MESKASDIPKQRIKEIETKADELVQKCNIMFVSSVNEKGYPRVCCVNKLSDKGFRDICFVTSKRCEKQGPDKAIQSEMICHDMRIRIVMAYLRWILHHYFRR